MKDPIAEMLIFLQNIYDEKRKLPTGSNMPPATISFIDRHVPPLPDNTYTLNVKQTLSYSVEGQDQTHEFQKTHVFYVSGSRFTLPPKQIQKVFPPPNTEGDFHTVLPHIVFQRRTLPWERSSGAPNDSAWLALMVFGQFEAPTTTIGTLADLFPASADAPEGKLPAGHLSYGNATQVGSFLAPGEKASDPCVWMDLAPDAFSLLAPSADDLAWNAHARCRTESDGSSTDYAVIVANRLPPWGQRVIVHLVSLEGLAAHLPDDKGVLPPTCDWGHLRLVSLKNWSFQVAPLQAGFVDLLTGLNGGQMQPSSIGSTQIGDSQLRLPAGYRPGGATSMSDTLPLDSGYTVLAKPLLSQGVWYRGPFLPTTCMPLSADPAWSEGLLPASHADALEVLVPATPGSDCSLAAAWQLGRLLALADTGFASAQVAWKRTCRAQLNVAIRHRCLDSHASRAKYAEAMRAIIADPSKIQALLGAKLSTSTNESDTLFIPPNLVDWLARLAQLHGVPFHYLVSDPTMLPAEAIRFFRIDPRWIAALLDGAWSLERQPRQVWGFDTAYQPWVQLLQGSLRAEGSPGTSNWPNSGVLLKSRVVSGYWPGIDFKVDSNAVILREDKLGSSTLLLLFDQPFQQITIQEPPEGIHFGFDGHGTSIGKSLRYVSIDGVMYPPASGPPPPVGSPVDGSALPSPIAQRAGGVIPFSALSSQFAVALQASAIGTAEFALQLIETVPAATFTLPPCS